MAKIDLTSYEWRELIFQNRNKDFGAFKMRSDSQSRHTIALLIVVAVVFVGLMIPKFLNLEKSNQQEDKLGMVDLMQVNQPIQEPEKKVEIDKPIALAPPQFIKSIRFIPPVVVDDVVDIKETDEMPNQSILNNSNTVISTITESGSNKGTVLKSDWNDEGGDLTGKEEVYSSIEQMAQFPGGEAELLKFISKNLVYPAKDIANNVQGKVVLRFVVSKSGVVDNVEVMRSLTLTADNEAIRVVKSLPRFIPGRQNGVNVSVWYVLPISYKLEFN